MPLDLRQENENIEMMKKKLMEQFQQASNCDCEETEMILAATANAYAALIQTQLALQHVELPGSAESSALKHEI